MTELSFLIDLLLNHRLQKTTKDAVAERIKGLSQAPMPTTYPQIVHMGTPLVGPPQAASTLAAMARHGITEAQPIAPVAQTAAAAQALASRNQAISESISGKIEKGQTRPRKF